MESNKELVSIIRGVEKEKLKYGIVVLKELIKKKIDSNTKKIVEFEIEKLNLQLNDIISNLEDDTYNDDDME
jgi:vacuolar-type H+-ATPase subunit F/Vma7